jgi:predicted RNA-binding protein (virulence factor B family)
MECRGTVYALAATGMLVRGDDGSRIFLPRSECIGRRPGVGDRVMFDVEMTARGPLAIGARRLAPAGRRVTA